MSGYHVVRFTDSRVLEQTEWVLDRLRDAISFFSPRENFIQFFHMGVDWPPWGGDPTAPARTILSDWAPPFSSHTPTNDTDRWTWMRDNIYPTWMSRGEGERATMVGASLEALTDEKSWPIQRQGGT
jgi:hypothetical protein